MQKSLKAVIMMIKVREVVEASIKKWCASNNYTFVCSDRVGSYIAVSITGDRCAEPFKKFLQEEQLEFTTPCMGCFGVETYIKVN